MNRCEFCQDECVDLVPVVNRDVMSAADFVWVCVGCAKMVRDEYAADLFRSPVDFLRLRDSRWPALHRVRRNAARALSLC